MISSSLPIYFSPNEKATAFIDPVVPEVNTISSVLPALIKARTSSLAFSYSSEALSLKA